MSAAHYLGEQRLFTLIASFWVGSLLTVGYLVAPAIFSALTDRQVAGMVAGAIFRIEAYLSITISIALLVLANLLVRRGLNAYRLARWLLLVMLLCSLLGVLVLMPWMNTLSDQALMQGMPVMLSPSAELFGKLHGASSALYLIQSALGIYLVWRLISSYTNQY